jgi:hypothetical protein
MKSSLESCRELHEVILSIVLDLDETLDHFSKEQFTNEYRECNRCRTLRTTTQGGPSLRWVLRLSIYNTPPVNFNNYPTVDNKSRAPKGRGFC